MTMVRANGITIHVEQMRPAVAPSGAAAAPPTMVMIHGMASDSLASWYFTLAKPLADAGMRVIMYDLRGHGHSDSPPDGYRLDDFVDDLVALLAELDATGPLHLMGNSFGGTIAFTYAMRHPERVAAIATIESAPPIEEWFRRVNQRLVRAAELVLDDEALTELSVDRAELGARWVRAAQKMLANTSLAQDISASRVRTEAEVTTIACPVLCIYGGESRVAEMAPVVARLLPQTQTVIVPGRKHSVLLDESVRVRDLTLSWLRQECRLALVDTAAH